jgi:hypothetical protein
VARPGGFQGAVGGLVEAGEERHEVAALGRWGREERVDEGGDCLRGQRAGGGAGGEAFGAVDDPVEHEPPHVGHGGAVGFQRNVVHGGPACHDVGSRGGAE